jgi:glycosyltransferase involved in cell wall biosynthesis
MSTQVPYHIAVILPERYRGGTLRGAINAARMLALGAKDAGDALKISFGHLDLPDVYSRADFEDLIDLEITIRPFKNQIIAADKVEAIYETWIEIPASDHSSEYLVFNDGISNFEDADFWLIVSDRLPACIAPHRPYAIITYDYIQRYVPQIFGIDQSSEINWLRFEKYLEIARKADFVICTTHQTRRDCINYCGADADRVILFPMEFDPIEITRNASIENVAKNPPYIMWTANSTEHKNHRNVILGLEIYFKNHPNSPLEIHLTGVYTDLFSEIEKSDPNHKIPYITEIRKLISQTEQVKNRLKILGNVSDSRYINELSRAEWLLHGALYDNGTFSLVEAAWLGIPAISSKYPAILEQCELFGLRPQLFDPYEPASLAKAIAACVSQRDTAINQLPSRNRLQGRTYKEVAYQYWSTFKSTLNKVGYDYIRRPA